MAMCGTCGKKTALNYPYCVDHYREAMGLDGAGAPQTPAISVEKRTTALGSTPLDVRCTWVYTAPSPDEGKACGAIEGQPCVPDNFMGYDDMRIIGFTSPKQEVHEVRFQAWKVQRAAVKL